MISTFVMVIVLLTPHFAEYKEEVDVFSTKEACEMALANEITRLKKEANQDYFYIGVCLSARPVTSSDV